jgi:hypothetical protein
MRAASAAPDSPSGAALLASQPPKFPRTRSLAYKAFLDAQILGRREPNCEAGGDGVGLVDALGLVVNEKGSQSGRPRTFPRMGCPASRVFCEKLEPLNYVAWDFDS